MLVETQGPISSWMATPDGARIGAHVGQRPHPQPEHLALGIQRQFGPAFGVAAMRCREEVVHPRRRPFHRAADAAARRRRPPRPRRRCRSSCRSRRRHRRPARAPCSAGMSEHLLADRRRAREEGICVLMRMVMRSLAAIVLGHHHPRLHRDRRQALVDQVERDDMRRLGEGRPPPPPRRRSASAPPYCRWRPARPPARRRLGACAQPGDGGSSS